MSFLIISQLVNENQELKSTVRNLQYEPREVDGVYKVQLEQSLYDNEALKVLFIL
jgi:hypothetical protein